MTWFGCVFRFYFKFVEPFQGSKNKLVGYSTPGFVRIRSLRPGLGIFNPSGILFRCRGAMFVLKDLSAALEMTIGRTGLG